MNLNSICLKNAYLITYSHLTIKSEHALSGIIESINDCSPDFIWVGLGTPKQQAWIHRHKHRFTRGALLAVGFAFDVNAGTKPDAPLWMQRCGMGWVFRLSSEPRRLLGRYAYYNTMFLWLLLKNGWKGMLWGTSKQG